MDNRAVRKLLYIDSSYTLDEIRERGLDHVLKIRHLEGYWDKVWSAHPLDIRPDDKAPHGSPTIEKVFEGHNFVRGRYGRFPSLAKLAPINAIFALASFVWALRKLVKRESISVIRAGDPLLCGLIGLIVARLAGAKLIVRINGDNDMIRQQTGQPMMPRLLRSASIEVLIEKLVIRRADAIIAPSQQYVDFAVSKGAEPDRCTIVRYGNLIDARHLTLPVDRPAVEDTDLARRLAERPWLLHVGRLHELKHAGDCIDVLEAMAQKGSDAGLCLVGDGPLSGDMSTRAAELGLADRVLFLGNVDQEFLSRLVPHCSVVLSPLTGRALSEVAFGQAAIVAYDLDWQGELVETGKTGILVPAGDTQAMADAAIQLIESPELAQASGQAVRVRAMEMLDPAKQTSIEQSIYAQLQH